MTVKIHIKNNRWAEGSFPNTPEGEAVFTITQERFDEVISNFNGIADQISTFIDWDTDNFEYLHGRCRGVTDLEFTYRKSRGGGPKTKVDTLYWCWRGTHAAL